MAEIGRWAIALTLLVSCYTTLMLIAGARRRLPHLLQSARNGIYVATISATVASGALLYLLVARDFSVRYVYEHGSTYLATVYTISAFWAGQEGSLLLWLWLVALLGAMIAIRRRVWQETSEPYVLAVMSVVQAFLALVLLLASDPFKLLEVVPVQGHGLNPLLQNIGMIVHPPLVFLGYALYTVPFAFALGALITGQMTGDWVQRMRRWSLLAWLFLGIGILLGAWWAYLELGWGGYWAWDPVENSSLIPWLTGTALLHSLMMQERRGAFKTWNVILISATFVLCIFATFVTRSGVIQSVHAFERSPIGSYFIVFILLICLALAALVYSRRRILANEQEVSGLLSREASLLLTNLLFGGAALVVLIGTIFPALTEALQGRQAALGASFYGRTAVPLSVVIVLLIGICPWLAWGGTSLERLRRDLLPSLLAALGLAILLFAVGVRETFALFSFTVCSFVALSIAMIFYRHTAARRQRTGENHLQAFFTLVTRNRRRYGAYVVHLGIVLIAIGVTGSSAYQSEAQVALSRGETISHQGYTLQYQDMVNQAEPGRERSVAVLAVSRGGKQIATLKPEKNFHRDVEQWVSEVAIRTTLKEDLYVSLTGVNDDGLATFQVLVNPLVVWLWIGGVILLIGAFLAWWPSACEE